MAVSVVHIPIDKAGRVVLPKNLRDRLGVTAGSEFEVLERDNQIILRPVLKEPQVVRKGRLLVVMPEKKLTVPVTEIIEKVRQKRIRDLYEPV